MKRLIFFVGILVFILLLRLATFYSYRPHIPLLQPVIFTGIVSDEPVKQGRMQILKIRIQNRVTMHVLTDTKLQFFASDRVKITGTIEQRVLNGEKAGFAVFFPTIEREKSGRSLLLTKLSSFRENFRLFYEKSLPPTHAALLYGIVFGGQGVLPDSFSDALKRTGVVHVVAASGMNVALVAGGLLFVFSKVLRRQTALVFCIIGIFFYTALAGFAPSLVRAALMGSMGLLAGLAGRQNLTLLSVLLAVFFMLFIDPLLLTDVGFQLSVAATLGIIILTPLFPVFQQRKDALFATDFTTTLAAQIATMPIILYYFHSIPLHALLVNILVLWTVPILMIIGGVAAGIGLLIEPLGTLISYLTYPILTYFITIVSVFGSMQQFSATVDTLPLTLLIGYYVLLFSIIIVISRRKRYELKT
jgi:competence protein ComEC